MEIHRGVKQEAPAGRTRSRSLSRSTYWERQSTEKHSRHGKALEEQSQRRRHGKRCVNICEFSIHGMFSPSRARAVLPQSLMTLVARLLVLLRPSRKRRRQASSSSPLFHATPLLHFSPTRERSHKVRCADPQALWQVNPKILGARCMRYCGADIGP